MSAENPLAKNLGFDRGILLGQMEQDETISRWRKRCGLTVMNLVMVESGPAIELKGPDVPSYGEPVISIPLEESMTVPVAVAHVREALSAMFKKPFTYVSGKNSEDLTEQARRESDAEIVLRTIQRYDGECDLECRIFRGKEDIEIRTGSNIMDTNAYDGAQDLHSWLAQRSRLTREVDNVDIVASWWREAEFHVIHTVDESKARCTRNNVRILPKTVVQQLMREKLAEHFPDGVRLVESTESAGEECTIDDDSDLGTVESVFSIHTPILMTDRFGLLSDEHQVELDMVLDALQEARKTGDIDVLIELEADNDRREHWQDPKERKIKWKVRWFKHKPPPAAKKEIPAPRNIPTNEILLDDLFHKLKRRLHTSVYTLLTKSVSLNTVPPNQTSEVIDLVWSTENGQFASESIELLASSVATSFTFGEKAQRVISILDTEGPFEDTKVSVRVELTLPKP